MNQIILHNTLDCFNGYTLVYTDGSKKQEGVGGAFLVPETNLTGSYNLPEIYSSFSAEAFAINKALDTRAIIQACGTAADSKGDKGQEAASMHICVISSGLATCSVKNEHKIVKHKETTGSNGHRTEERIEFGCRVIHITEIVKKR
nr:unnamed protein product [Callosobruchus analis]